MTPQIAHFSPQLVVERFGVSTFSIRGDAGSAEVDGGGQSSRLGDFHSREEFQTFLSEQGETAVRVTQQFVETSHSAGQKLFHFLRNLAADREEEKARPNCTLTRIDDERATMILASQVIGTLYLLTSRNNGLHVKNSTLDV